MNHGDEQEKDVKNECDVCHICFMVVECAEEKN